MELKELYEHKLRLLTYIEEMEHAIELCKKHEKIYSQRFLEGHLIGMKGKLITIESLIKNANENQAKGFIE